MSRVTLNHYICNTRDYIITQLLHYHRTITFVIIGMNSTACVEWRLIIANEAPLIQGNVERLATPARPRSGYDFGERSSAASAAFASSISHSWYR